MRVTFNELAERELNDAAQYYEHEQPGLGAAFITEVRRCTDAIAEHPEAGATVLGTIRRRLCQRFPYGLLYTLRMDLMTAKVLVWVARVGRDAELTPDAHRYFFDRYRRLAEYHRRRGHKVRAQRLQAKSDEHDQFGGSDGPPYAAAMGMPRPRKWLATDAVGRHHLGGPDEAA